MRMSICRNSLSKRLFRKIESFFVFKNHNDERIKMMNHACNRVQNGKWIVKNAFQSQDR